MYNGNHFLAALISWKILYDDAKKEKKNKGKKKEKQGQQFPDVRQIGHKMIPITKIYIIKMQ